MRSGSQSGTPAARRAEMSGMVVNAIRDAMREFLVSQPLDASRRDAVWEQFHDELGGALSGPPSSSRDGAVRPVTEHPVDSTIVNRAVHVVAEALGADGIGVELGKRVPWGAMGFLDAVTVASENLGAAFAQVAKHYGALTSTATLRFESRTHVPSRGGAPTSFAYLIQDQRSEEDDITHIIEFAFAFCLARSRAAAAGVFELDAVKLRRKGSAAAARMHEAFFGVAPQYEAAENAFVFERSLLALPLRNPNPTLVDVIEANASRFVPSTEEGLERRVAGVVARHLEKSGEVLAVDAAARAMGMSGRTLQSRLADLRTTFADLVDEVRKEKAMRLVRAPSMPLTEVAFALGFRSPASFSRAFRRWSGTTPTDARRRATGEVGVDPVQEAADADEDEGPISSDPVSSSARVR